MSAPTLPTSDLELKIQSDPSQIRGLRKAVEAFCLDAKLPQRDAEDVGLCVNEAVANVIVHAYAGARDRPIVLRARATAEGVEISIRDWGAGQDPSRMATPCHDPLVPGKLGMICLGQCMSQVKFIPQSDGMLLVMIKKKSCADNAHSGPGPSEHP